MRRKLGWAHVQAARFRRAARGRASWLADDLTSADHGRRDAGLDDLPPLDRLPPLDADRPGPDRPEGRRPVLAVVPDPDDDGPGTARTDGGRSRRPGPVDRTGTVVGPVPPVARRSAVPDRPVREDRSPAGRGRVGPSAGAGRLTPGWVAHPVSAARRTVSHQAHVAAFHGLRVPEYALRAARWAPRGVSRSVVGLCRWAGDYEGRELRWSAAARDDAREYLHLSRQRNQRVHNRVPLAIALAVAIGAVVLVGVLASPGSPADPLGSRRRAGGRCSGRWGRRRTARGSSTPPCRRGHARSPRTCWSRRSPPPGCARWMRTGRRDRSGSCPRSPMTVPGSGR